MNGFDAKDDVDTASRVSALTGLKKMLMKHRHKVPVILSFFMIVMIFINSLLFNSPFIGVPASIVYFLINGHFLGGTFFKESRLSLPLGILLLTVLLGIFGWVFMIMYRLSTIEVTITLCIASCFSLIVSKYERMKMIVAKARQFVTKFVTRMKL